MSVGLFVCVCVAAVYKHTELRSTLTLDPNTPAFLSYVLPYDPVLPTEAECKSRPGRPMAVRYSCTYYAWIPGMKVFSKASGFHKLFA